jgi:hypothetical protein
VQLQPFMDSVFHVASTPLYAPLSANNSATLPACFALRLNNPMPMCLPLVRRIQQITEMECGDLSTPHPLLSLVTQHASTGQLDCANNRGLFVVCFGSLCYFVKTQLLVLWYNRRGRCNILNFPDKM